MFQVLNILHSASLARHTCPPFQMQCNCKVAHSTCFCKPTSFHKPCTGRNTDNPADLSTDCIFKTCSFARVQTKPLVLCQTSILFELLFYVSFTIIYRYHKIPDNIYLASVHSQKQWELFYMIDLMGEEYYAEIQCGLWHTRQVKGGSH